MARGRNFYEESKAQGRLWTPTELRGTGELYGWFDPGDVSTISVSTGISTWRDKSGFGRNATQGTAANQPAYSFSGFPGAKAAISPDGSNDSFSWSGPAYNSTDGFCLFATLVAPSGSGNFNLCSGITGGPNFDIDTNKQRVVRSFQALIVGSSTTLSNTTYILGWEAANNYVATWTNGVVNTSTSTNPAFTSGSTTFFNDQGGGFYANVVRQMVFTKLLPTRRRQQLEGFLAWESELQSRLTVNHPYRNRPPLIGT